eukprot:gene7427-13186_t
MDGQGSLSRDSVMLAGTKEHPTSGNGPDTADRHATTPQQTGNGGERAMGATTV